MSEHDKHRLAERLVKLREMAAAARESALRATADEMRKDYQALAESWERLIKEIEAS
jgi:Ribonuclease G/E